MDETSNIVFFDGLCPMCHGWVKRILRHDKKKVFRFAPLEGETATRILEPLLPAYHQHNSIILFHNNKVFLRSSAVLKIVSLLGWPYKILCLGYIIPKTMRDAWYDAVAARRFSFGKRYESCPLPPRHWQDRFI